MAKKTSTRVTKVAKAKSYKKRTPLPTIKVVAERWPDGNIMSFETSEIVSSTSLLVSVNGIQHHIPDSAAPSHQMAKFVNSIIRINVITDLRIDPYMIVVTKKQDAKWSDIAPKIARRIETYTGRKVILDVRN